MKSVLTKQDLDESKAKQMFRKFDANNSGEIDMRELGILIKTLGLNMGSEEINNAMVDLDKDKNGAMSFEEFWSWFQKAAVVKFGSSQTPARSPGFKLQNKIRNQFNSERRNERDQNAVDAEVATINRPSTAMSRTSFAPSPTKMGTWVTRN